GVVWVPVDAADEADYVLGRLAARAGPDSVHWVEVCRVDPLRFWSSFFGAGCTPGRCQEAGAPLWLIDGGERLPTASLRDHLGAVRHWACGAGVQLLLPVFRGAFDGGLRSGADRVLHIPGLAGAGAGTRAALAEALVAERLPLLPPADRR